MATPHVAGAAALVAQQHPDWDGQRIKQALVASTAPAPDLTAHQQGTGRVDLARAVEQTVTAEQTAINGGATRQGDDMTLCLPMFTDGFGNVGDSATTRTTTSLTSSGANYLYRTSTALNRKYLRCARTTTLPSERRAYRLETDASLPGEAFGTSTRLHGFPGPPKLRPLRIKYACVDGDHRALACCETCHPRTVLRHTSGGARRARTRTAAPARLAPPEGRAIGLDGLSRAPLYEHGRSRPVAKPALTPQPEAGSGDRGRVDITQKVIGAETTSSASSPRRLRHDVFGTAREKRRHPAAAAAPQAGHPHLRGTHTPRRRRT